MASEQWYEAGTLHIRQRVGSDFILVTNGDEQTVEIYVPGDLVDLIAVLQEIAEQRGLLAKKGKEKGKKGKKKGGK